MYIILSLLTVRSQANNTSVMAESVYSPWKSRVWSRRNFSPDKCENNYCDRFHLYNSINIFILVRHRMLGCEKELLYSVELVNLRCLHLYVCLLKSSFLQFCTKLVSEIQCVKRPRFQQIVFVRNTMEMDFVHL